MNHATCPYCGKQHAIITFFRDSINVQLLRCPFLFDLIYLNGVTANKAARKLIKDSLFGA